jgi:hypothetical protein
MKLGFTGSSHRGWTIQQRDRVLEVLEEYRPIVVHGACIKCDDLLDNLAYSMGLTRVVFPSDHPTKSALTTCVARGGDIIVARDPLPMLVRNRLIVHSSWRLIATPSSRHEVVRSGTWMTVRYARKHLGVDKVEVIEP